MNNNIESLTYYAATKKYDLRFPTLEEDLDVDVVIIGGGFSGINTALELAERGITNIAILEGRHLGYGGTGLLVIKNTQWRQMQSLNCLHVKQITPSRDYCALPQSCWVNILMECHSGSEKQWFGR